MKPLALGILSTARIARGFCQGVQPSKLVTLAAVASRTRTAADQFASEFNLPKAYSSYAAMLADPAIDAVYIALPNSMHEHWSMQALSAGKHVLCEKPLVRGAQRARTLFEYAKSQGLFLVEAFPYWFQQQSQLAIQKVQRNEIGAVRAVQASFGFHLTNSIDVRLDPALDGGALMDTGCYCLSFIRQIMGERGTVSYAKAQMTPSGVDLMMQANLAFSGNRWAQVFCNMNSAPHRHASIIGSQGVIQTDFVNHTSDRPSYLNIKQGTDWDSHLTPISYTQANGFFAEAEAFANLIAKADWAAAQHWASISEDTAGMLDDIFSGAI
jgi:predicted dehydrogenase